MARCRLQLIMGRPFPYPVHDLVSPMSVCHTHMQKRTMKKSQRRKDVEQAQNTSRDIDPVLVATSFSQLEFYWSRCNPGVETPTHASRHWPCIRSPCGCVHGIRIAQAGCPRCTCMRFWARIRTRY